MKKVLFTLCSFLLVLQVVKAYTYTDFSIKYDNNGTSTIIPMEHHEYDGEIAFLFHPFPNYEIKDLAYLNNLAYLGLETDSVEVHTVIQLLIWENIYPNYSFSILLNDSIYDYTSIKDNIIDQLNTYKNIKVLDNYDYYGKYNDPLDIISDYSLSNYYVENTEYLNNGNEISIRRIDKVGDYKLNFINTLKTYNNLIYATSLAYEPFSINIHATGNIIRFKVNPVLNNEYYYNFEVYDITNNRFLEMQSISPENNEIYYRDDVSIRLSSITNYKYEDYPEIFVYHNGDHIYEIDYDRPIKKGILTINNNSKGILEYPINLTFYDLSFFPIKEIKCLDSCDVELDYGRYIILDNNKNSYSYYDFLNDGNYFVKNYLYGIKANKEIYHIFKDNQELSFKKNNEYYVFDDFIFPNTYTFEYSDGTKDISLIDPNNFIEITDLGLIYSIEFPEYVEQEKIIEPVISDIKTEPIIATNDDNVKEIFLEEGEEISIVDLIIDVPDTGISLSNGNVTYYVEMDYKYYYCY